MHPFEPMLNFSTNLGVNFLDFYDILCADSHYIVDLLDPTMDLICIILSICQNVFTSVFQRDNFMIFVLGSMVHATHAKRNSLFFAIKS